MNEFDLSPPPMLEHKNALLLDFDGTLVDIAKSPGAVHIDASLKKLLGRLQARHPGRLAIVSGRSIEQLDTFLGEHVHAITLIGSHGAELKPAGGDLLRPARPAAICRAANLFAKAFAHRSGVIVENKSLGVAVHFRLEPAAEPEVRALLFAFGAENGLAMQEGKMMIELRIPGHDKGTAIAELLRQPPFINHPAFFLGDDLTDEPGFLVCEKAGGAGILVGAPRPTAARYRLDDVRRVRKWLAGVSE